MGMGQTSTRGGAVTIRAVIFDFDGVLVASEPLHYEAESAVIQQFAGEPLAWDAFSDTLGMSEVDSYRHYADRHGIDEEPERLASLGRQIFMGMVDTRLELVDGARDVLDWLPRAGLRWAIASSGGIGYIERALTRFGLLDMFDGRVSSVDMVASGKPAPDVFIHAAGRLGLPTADCVVIEDAHNGITAARRGGMKAIRYLADGGHDDQAHATVARLAEVPSVIGRLRTL